MCNRGNDWTGRDGVGPPGRGGTGTGGEGGEGDGTRVGAADAGEGRRLEVVGKGWKWTIGKLRGHPDTLAPSQRLGSGGVLDSQSVREDIPALCEGLRVRGPNKFKSTKARSSVSLGSV